MMPDEKLTNAELVAAARDQGKDWEDWAPEGKLWRQLADALEAADRERAGLRAHSLAETLRESLESRTAERDAARAALQKISDIRDSIIGLQGFNWSEHAYPLVAALDEAGYPGAGYETARNNLGTLFEQLKAAETERDAAVRVVEAARVVESTCELPTHFDELHSALAAYDAAKRGT